MRQKGVCNLQYSHNSQRYWYNEDIKCLLYSFLQCTTTDLHANMLYVVKTNGKRCISAVDLDIFPAENLLQLHTVKHTSDAHFILQAQIEQSQAEQ